MPKAKNIYVFGAEPQSGKSVVLLGIMELLSRHVQKLGFFRPLVREGETKDDAIRLISSRYQLPFPNRVTYGMTYERARALVGEERYDEVLKRMLEGYKALESECDVVVCLGTGFHDIPPVLSLDFNIDLANNLGALVAPVATGYGRTPQEIIRRSSVLLNLLETKRCDALALFVNRVAPERVDETIGLIAQGKTRVPIFLLPELAMLAKPTVGEIGEDLGASRWSGESESFTREVEDIKVGAMELPNFLDLLVDGTLVITPGDRSDIILGSLLADAATSYPRVAGLLLTGGLRPAPQVQRLIEGLRKSPLPVLTTSVDTFTAGTRASQVRGRIRSENPRKMAIALGHMEKYIDDRALYERIALSRPARVTPIMFEHILIERAKSNRRHIVLPEGTEERILRAAEILLLRGVADLTLLGPIGEIEQKASFLGLSLQGATFLDPADPVRREEYAHTYYELRKHKGISEQMAFDLAADVAYFGTLMVYRGEADGLVSGAVHTTAHTLRPAFEIIGVKPGYALASSVFFMCLPDRVFVFGDCAVNPEPTMDQLADIAVSSAETAQAFGIEPRVAMLSYSTGESGKGADVDKVREATRRVRSLRPDLPVEGPIQYDAAVDPDVARVKLPGSHVAGRATVFIFPDLNNGNITYKAVQRSANALAIGPVIQGLKMPVNDLSRGATVTDIVNTVAITAIQAQDKEAGGVKVVVINSGSSSVKYQVFESSDISVLSSGVLERIGESESRHIHRAYGPSGTFKETVRLGQVANHEEGFRFILSMPADSAVIKSSAELLGIGHRVVHGGEAFQEPVLIDENVIETIRDLIPLAPLHNPANLMGIEAAKQVFPGVPQVAVFDTAFHQSIPPYAFIYALPYSFYALHRVRRYGFHGTSHLWVAKKAAAHLEKPLTSLNLITLHLGNGASAAAIRQGLSVDTSMGMTPLEGLVMGTRSGDLDPAVPFYMRRVTPMADGELEALLNKGSGMKGICGANDMREILQRANRGDPLARLALELYCYRIKKFIGAYFAVLGRVDAIVFTGGIGENAAPIRKQCCQELEGLGITVDDGKNEKVCEEVLEIQRDGAPVKVLAIRTNEEREIAQQTINAIEKTRGRK